MSAPDLKKSLHSVIARQKFGDPNLFGSSFFGWSKYGDKNEYSAIYRYGKNARGLPNEYGVATFGANFFGQIINDKPKQQVVKYYSYPITYSATQLANRARFRAGMQAWQALSVAEKAQYRERVIGKPMTATNLFLREWLRI